MSELNVPNYKRIYFINGILTIPLIVLFAWPYFYAAFLIGLTTIFCYVGAFIFSIPFMLTIIHGHVTMALGTLHRHHYYDWLKEHPITWGLLFHPMFFRTRFRLIMLLLSLILLPIGFFWNI